MSPADVGATKCSCCEKPIPAGEAAAADPTLCRRCWRTASDVWKRLRQLWFGEAGQS